MRETTLTGMEEVARRGIRPDVIYVDAEQQYESVKSDVETALRLFPAAMILGDDWDWAGVRQAVSELAGQDNLQVEVQGNAWRLKS